MNRLDKYKPLIIIFTLFFINLFLFYGKMINIHTDFGREILFSKMVSQGVLLYRDIFNTFVCPFSYLFNGLVLKFAPVNLNTFYFLGALNCAVILVSIYLISRKFLSTFVSCVITVFVMYYCCFYAGLMNFLTPYSYAIVYGLCACLVSVLLYINYLEADKKNFLYTAFFFGGLSAACKYEFFAYALLLFVFFFFKKENLRTVAFCAGSFVFIPALCLIILMFQGLEYVDVKNYLEILNRFVNQPYLSKVYALTCNLSFASLIAAGRTFIFAAVMFFVFYFLNKKSLKALKAISFIGWSALVFGVLFNFSLMEYFSYSFFGFITYLVAILAIFNIKNIKKDLPVLFLVLSALCVSLKSFWFLSSNFYGRYFLPLLIIALSVLICTYCSGDGNISAADEITSKEFADKDSSKYQSVLQKTICAFLIFLSFAAFRLNLISLVLKNQTLKTPYGTVKMTNSEYEIYKPLIDYVNDNTQKTDRIVVLGQAPMLNFLTDRPSIPFFSHFDEAIAGAITSGNVIKAYQSEKPEYIVIFEGADKSSSYCSTYGQKVCEGVFENYIIDKKINPSKKNDTVYIMSESGAAK